MTRAPLYVLTVAWLGGLLWPLRWPRGRDDFPVSPYPMFTAKRDVVAPVNQVLWLRADEDATRSGRPVPSDLIAQGAVLHAATELARAIAGGRAAELCARVAQHMDVGAYDRAAAIAVVTSVYDARAYLLDPHLPPLSRTVHARCVARAP